MKDDTAEERFQRDWSSMTATDQAALFRHTQRERDTAVEERNAARAEVERLRAQLTAKVRGE